MNSISRAVTAKICEISNKRQRLVGDEKIDFAENPSWSEPELGEFNYYDPPNIVIPTQDWRETPIMETVSEQKSPKSPGDALTKKMTDVVRKLSPFSSSKEEKLQEEPLQEPQAEKKSKLFKDTRNKVERLKKSFKSKEQQQLIESDDEHS